MKIEILGTGCPKCKMLFENVNSALKNSGKTAEVIKIEDIAKITEYGIMTPPALVVDGKIKSTGKLLTSDEIEKLL